jgi:hypothetical protein
MFAEVIPRIQEESCFGRPSRHAAYDTGLYPLRPWRYPVQDFGSSHLLRNEKRDVLQPEET